VFSTPKFRGRYVHVIVLVTLLILSNLSISITSVVQAQEGLRVEGIPLPEFLEQLGLEKCDVYGGTLKIALPSEPNTFNWFVAGSSWSLLSLFPVYSRLVRIINGTLVFELAESIEWSPDHKVLTIKIVKGAKFHDGKPVTAEDVAFTINVLAHKSWCYYHGYFASVEKAEVVDDYTVKVYFKEPDAGFIYNALSVMNIMPKHIWEPLLKEKGDALAKYNPKIPDEVIGSGPFKIVEYVPGQYVKYKAYEDFVYGRPGVDELLFVFITEANVAILAVQKGDVDSYIGWVTAEVVPQLKATPYVEIHTYTSPTFYHWGLNNLKWPFNITDFRRALAYAVDKEAIIRDILLGYGIPGSPGVVPPVGVNLQWFNPNVYHKYTFNLSKTAEILDKLGFKDIDGDGWREAPDGSDFSFEIYAPSYDIVRVRAAEMIAKWLSEIPGGGLKAIPRAAEWKTVWPLIREAKVDSWLLGSGPGMDITWLIRRFHSRPMGTGNWARYSNPEVDRLTELLRVTFDPEERKKIAWKIQEILADEVPIIVLYYRKFINPYRVDKFERWFKPADDDAATNFITLLRVQLKKAPTTSATTPTTALTTTPTSTTPTPTTPTPTTSPTPTPRPAMDMTSIAIAIVIIIIIIAIIAFALRRRR